MKLFTGRRSTMARMLAMASIAYGLGFIVYYKGANEGAEVGYILGVSDAILDKKKAYEGMIDLMKSRRNRARAR